MSTTETLFKEANKVLQENLHTPVLFQKLAERGYVPQTEEQALELLKVSEAVAEKLAAGEILPIPARELEEDTDISKHAAEKVANDFFAFAPDAEVTVKEVDEPLKKSAAVISFVGSVE